MGWFLHLFMILTFLVHVWSCWSGSPWSLIPPTLRLAWSQSVIVSHSHSWKSHSLMKISFTLFITHRWQETIPTTSTGTRKQQELWLDLFYRRRGEDLWKRRSCCWMHFWLGKHFLTLLWWWSVESSYSDLRLERKGICSIPTVPKWKRMYICRRLLMIRE